MAITPNINNYPVLEANILKARHTGRIWSQYKLDEADFAGNLAYNGMILAIDDVAKSVKFPTATTTDSEVYALHFSAEEEYEHKGLNTFAVGLEHSETNPNISVQYPRMFELSVGDVFHTNCVALDDEEISSINEEDDDSSLVALLDSDTPIYGGISTSGYILLGTTKPTIGPVLQVVKFSTMPNGDWGVKFVVRKV